MHAPSHTRWVVLSRGELYSAKEYGLTFERGIPKEVPADIAAELKRTGSFIITDASGEPIRFNADDADNTPSVAYIPPPPVFDASTTLKSADVLMPMETKPRDTKNEISAGDDLNGKDILLRRFGGIGDVVFVAHVAQEIKRRWPKSRVRLAVNPEYIAFAELFDAVDSAMAVDASCTYEVVSAHDYVIPFHNVIEKNHEYHADFFDAHWKRTGLGDTAPITLPRLRVNRLAYSNAQAEAKKFLNSVGIGDLPFIAIAIGTAGPLKTYNSEQMKIVAEIIARTSDASPGIPIVCLGNFHQILDRPFKPSPETRSRISFAMDLPLEVSAEIVRRSRVCIGTDTGLVQFAASIHVPTVSLWGPINPAYTISHYNGPQKFIEGNTDCRPCNTLRLARCPYYKADGAACMKSINPEEVAAAALSLYERERTHAADTLETGALGDKATAIGVQRHSEAKTRVAVILDNGRMHSGGGHYLWRIACTLAREYDFDVSVFTDAGSDFVYESNGAPVKIKFDAITHENAYPHIHGLDASFDVLIAGPPHMGEAVSAWKNGVRPDGVTILVVYETPGMIATHRKGLDTKEEFWSNYKNALYACDYIWCISKPVREALYAWDARFADKKITTVDLVYPAVNTITADVVRGEGPRFDSAAREDSVVIIGRKMPYKRIVESAAAIMSGPLATRALKTGKLQKLVLMGDGIDESVRSLLPSIPGVSLELSSNVREHDKFYALHRAKCVVHPSDLEGFGIVIAEAMYSGVPVVVQSLPEYEASFASHTYNYSDEKEMLDSVLAILDAYDHDSSLEVLCEQIEEAAAFVSMRYSIAAMSKRLRTIFGARKKLCAVREGAAKRAVANRIESATKNLRVAIVSPWGTQCGIAETTRQVVDHYSFAYRIFAAMENETATAFNDARSVRCWDRSFASTRALQDEILAFQPHIVHFHHEFSFYRTESRFFSLIQAFRELGIKVIVTAHTYAPSAYFDKLAESVDKLILTKPLEGSPENSVSIPLPILTKYPRAHSVDARRSLNFPVPHTGLVVGSIGMWVPHKGYHELLQTLNDVSLRCGADTRYLLAGYANPRTPYSSRVYDEHRELFQTNRAIRRCDFVDEETLFRLALACDILVYNYQVDGHFSSSAALRSGMAAGRPIITTHSPMFSEFDDGVHVLKVPFGDLQALTNAICRLYADTALRASLVRTCDEYIEACTPEKIAAAYSELYLSLLA